MARPEAGFERGTTDVLLDSCVDCGRLSMGPNTSPEGRHLKVTPGTPTHVLAAEVRKTAVNYLPSRNAECLCGSGEKFKRCCADYLKDRKGHSVRQLPEGEKGELLRARAELCQYVIWHQRHTRPAVAVGAPFAEELLKIDVDAFAGFAHALLHAYAKRGRFGEFSAVLDRLRGAINSSAWERKRLYLKAFVAQGQDLRDVDAAKKEFARLGSMKHESDPEILQYYLDLYGDDLDVTDKISFCERIVSLVKEPAIRLQYNVVRSSLFITLGELAKAKDELSASVDAYRKTPSEDASCYPLLQLGAALELLGTIGGDIEVLSEAAATVKAALATGELNQRGKALCLQRLGDIARAAGDLDTAKAAYEDSLLAWPTPIVQVFLARVLAVKQDRNAALAILDEIDKALLTPAELADYVFVLAGIVRTGGPKDRIDEVLDMLRALQMRAPIFREIRDDMTIALLHLRAEAPSSPSRVSPVLERLAIAVSSISKYAELKPNIAGLGLNLNRMLDDVADALMRKGRGGG